MRAKATAVALLALLLSAAPAAAQTERTITVMGSASTTVPNDTARFTFGVVSRRRSATAALQATSVRARRLVGAIQAAGVQGPDVTTGTLSVQRMVVTVRGSRVAEYEAVNSVRIVVRQVSRAGAVVDAAVRAGATSVAGPVFSPGNVAATYRQALRMAFADAREKARLLAEDAGATLGPVVTITENGAQTDTGSSPSAGAPQRQRASPPVRPGTTTVQADVTVVFALS
ncbi:MAG: SIMPL domain-containing protein [Actinomycetota bacterium]|nr:SIMPL domain-containing protein [Actinomycetota bacterium]